MPEDRALRLTPGALIRLLDGHREREALRWRRQAAMTAHLMNVSGKVVRKRVTADDLVGPWRARPVPPELRDDDPGAAGLDVVAALNELFGGKDDR